jgi:hypothetical protein
MSRSCIIAMSPSSLVSRTMACGCSTGRRMPRADLGEAAGEPSAVPLEGGPLGLSVHPALDLP